MTWYFRHILDILFIILIPVEALCITLNFGLLCPLLQNLSLRFLFLYQMNLEINNLYNKTSVVRFLFTL